MKKNTRFAFNAYLQQLARLNGVAVEELSSKFTVEPSVPAAVQLSTTRNVTGLKILNPLTKPMWLRTTAAPHWWKTSRLAISAPLQQKPERNS